MQKHCPNCEKILDFFDNDIMPSFECSNCDLVFVPDYNKAENEIDLLNV